MKQKPTAVVRSLKVWEWPKEDQLAWDAACRPPNGLRRGGKAAHLKKVTRDDLARRYGQFLDYAARSGMASKSAGPGALVTPALVDGYVAELRARVGSVTLYGNIYKLRRIAELLAPGKDFTWLREIEQELEWDMRPASKTHRIVDSDRIVKAGFDLMLEAENDEKSSPLRNALQFRNGLMIAFLALLPLRLKNFSSLRIGFHVLRVGESWHVVLLASETKSRRAEERRVPDILEPYLVRYLEVYRRCLRPQDQGLWVGIGGRSLTAFGCERIIREATFVTLGTRISPHLFRTCAASMAYLHAGDQPYLASALLQHTDRTVTEAHYNRAKGASYGRAFSLLVER
jgi:integrase